MFRPPQSTFDASRNHMQFPAVNEQPLQTYLLETSESRRLAQLGSIRFPSTWSTPWLENSQATLFASCTMQPPVTDMEKCHQTDSTKKSRCVCNGSPAWKYQWLSVTVDPLASSNQDHTCSKNLPLYPIFLCVVPTLLLPLLKLYFQLFCFM